MPEPRVEPESHVTLHYRLAVADGATLVSTFGGPPATFHLGHGQLAEPFERCLAGMQAGARRAFELAPEHAFGPRHEHLVMRAPLADIPAGVASDPGDVLELRSPEGHPLSARVVSRDGDSVLLDFNHPLAGRALVFEAEVVGIL
jgi:FKBP-type peptidyl-prolyl cis-trans isomerase SlpA